MHRLAGAGGAVAVGVLAGVVDVEADMAVVLDAAHVVAACHQFGDQLLDERRLPRIVPADDGDCWGLGVRLTIASTFTCAFPPRPSPGGLARTHSSFAPQQQSTTLSCPNGRCARASAQLDHFVRGRSARTTGERRQGGSMRKEAKERLEGCAALACALLPAFFYLRTENSLCGAGRRRRGRPRSSPSPCSPRSRLREECWRCAPALAESVLRPDGDAVRGGRPARLAGRRRSPAWTGPPPTRSPCRP